MCANTLIELAASDSERFSLEAAYIGMVLLIALCGTPVSPLRQAPQKALEVVQASPSIMTTAKLELLEFDVEYSGGYIGDHPHRNPKNKPRETVTIRDKVRNEGPRLTGTLVLSSGADGEVKDSTVSGWFKEGLDFK